tara:strand:+ start:3783 stop:4742 length:960 start_codon:yes stop_codon:yes gene_type:complete
MKNSIRFKLFVLLILVLIPVSILYLNFDYFIFNKNKENYKNNKHLINPCRNQQKAHAYNQQITYFDPRTTISNSDPLQCKYSCNNNDKCNFTILDNTNTCHMIELKEDDSRVVNINCNNNIISNENNYLGEIMVDKDFYNNNTNKFDHIDYILNEANNIRSKYNDIHNKLEELEGTSDSRSNLQSDYRDVNRKVRNLADFLNLSKNSLYSNFVNDPKYSITVEDKVKLNGEDVEYSDMIKNFKKLYNESNNLDTKFNSNSLEYNRKYLINTILCILMIITVIIFLIYKISPDLISDNIILCYFIGILFLVFFIHIYLKI